MKILVTGGAGFIGKHLTQLLLDKGHQVTVLDSLETASAPTASINFIQGSILNEALVTKLVKEVDQVIHLAAAVGVANIIQSPLRGLRTNVIGSEIVIRACAIAIKPILLTSSSEIYGKNNSNSLNEMSDRIIGVPQKSRWSYSDSKAIEEAFAIAYFREVGLPTKIVRLFNTVGPGQVGDYGMVLPRFMRSAINDEEIEIYGDGNQTRCFMHVIDAVAGIVKFMENDEMNGEVVNLGNPQEITIKDLASRIISITNSKSSIRFKQHEEVFGMGFEDMDRRVPDVSKATNKLGWTPTKNIEEIVQEIYEYELSELN